MGGVPQAALRNLRGVQTPGQGWALHLLAQPRVTVTAIIQLQLTHLKSHTRNACLAWGRGAPGMSFCTTSRRGSGRRNRC